MKKHRTSSIVLSLALLATFAHLASSAHTCDFWICNPNICGSNCLQCGRASMIGVFNTTTVICPINNEFCFTAIYDSARIDCLVQKCDSCTDKTAESCTGCANYSTYGVVNACGTDQCYTLNYSYQAPDEIPVMSVDPPPNDAGSSGNTGTTDPGSSSTAPKPSKNTSMYPDQPSTTPASPPDVTSSPPTNGGAGECHIIGTPIAATTSAEDSAVAGSAGKPAVVSSADTAGTASPGTNTVEANKAGAPIPNCTSPVPGDTPVTDDGSVGTGSTSGSGSGTAGTGTVSGGGTSSNPETTDTGNMQSAPTVTGTSASSSNNSGDQPISNSASTGDGTTPDGSGGGEGTSGGDGAANTTSNVSGNGQSSNINNSTGSGQNIPFPVLSGVYLPTGIVLTSLITALAVY